MSLQLTPNNINECLEILFINVFSRATVIVVFKTGCQHKYYIDSKIGVLSFFAAPLFHSIAQHIHSDELIGWLSANQQSLNLLLNNE